MDWISRSIKSLYLKSAQPPGDAANEREAALKKRLEERTAEFDALALAGKEHGAQHIKFKQRLEALQAEVLQQKHELTLARLLIKRQAIDVAEIKSQLAIAVSQRAAYGACTLMRPGLPYPARPDPEVEKRYNDYLHLARTVWAYPMRLGVLHQHGPRLLTWGTLPKLKPRGPLPVISVVTPSFRQAEFLERTMLSVLDQNYPHLDYLVADGGSSDGSVEIIQKHVSRLKGWISEPVTGPSHAVNKGFTQSTGEIMAWLNAGDLWTPGTLDYVAAYFTAHPEVDVVYGHRLVIDEKDHQVGHWTLPRHDGAVLLWADFVPQETLFWRRRIWDKAGGTLDESFQWAFDWDLLLRFQRADAKIVRLPRILGCYRAHVPQKSSADTNTVGASEIARLRERELGAAFHTRILEQITTRYQRQAIRCDKLLRMGIRW